MSQELQQEPDEETALLYALVQDSHLLTPVILIGASALIPVPFLDDIVKSYLQKYLFRTLAEREGLQLQKEENEELTEEPSGGCCALGCLGSALLYPLKKILRKLFFFLEIKRAVDQSTTALAQAWLFQLTLKKKLWAPGQGEESAAAVRMAIRKSCSEEGTKPLEKAVSEAFSGAKSTLQEFASKFTKKDTDQKDVEKAVGSVELDDQEEMAGLTRRLSDSVQQVSESYVGRLASVYKRILAQELSEKPSEDKTT